MACLADFAEHRRFHLLWQHHISHSVDEIERLITRAAGRACRLPPRPAAVPELAAVLGSDGRYHLHRNGRRTCHPGSPFGDESADGWQHQQSCHWWTDGHRYRLQPPQGAIGELHRCDSRVVHHTVHAVGEVMVPEEVPRPLRCPTSYGWPAVRTSATTLGRVRQQLVDAFGPLCVICGHEPGQVIDHDHFTRYVRGLLCQYCNAWVERCLHPSGCGFADYLNHPPATGLRLVHPRTTPLRGAALARVRRTGLNPFPAAPKTEYLHSSAELLDALGRHPDTSGEHSRGCSTG